jgi:hypothetical protein
MTFRFVGNASDIGEGIRLTNFGQAVELSDELAREAALGGCALVPDAEFQAIGFTDKELVAYASAGSHERAPADFLEKKKSALIAAHELRVRIEGGE